MTTEVTSEIWIALRSCELLSQASDDRVYRLAQSSRVDSYRKGDRLLSREDAPTEIGIVMRGKVRAVHFGDDGRAVTVLTATVGMPVGLISSITKNHHQNAYESIENGTTVVWFPRPEFEQLMEDEPRVMKTVIEMLARRMQSVITLVHTLSADVPARVAIYIGLLLQEQGSRGRGPVTVDLGVSRVELSARLGTVPETLSRAFHVLQDEGVIESRGREVVVLDREALLSRTNGVL